MSDIKSLLHKYLKLILRLDAGDFLPEFMRYESYRAVSQNIKDICLEICRRHFDITFIFSIISAT